MKIEVFAPASIGNVSIGFDVLGLAVKPADGTLLGDVVAIESAQENQLSVIGEFASKLPSDAEQNIVWHCLQLFNHRLLSGGGKVQAVHLTLDKKMPVGSGLGSSACSVVAALVALNKFYKAPFNDDELLKMMGEMEAQISGSLHYDNVAPCFLGGLQLMLPTTDKVTTTLPSFDNHYYIMAYPGIEVSTKAAREVLPEQYSRAQVIEYGQILASFVDACYRQDEAQVFSHFEDVIAEPYRKHLLPGFEQARDYLLAQGGLAVGISGSGPTLFCICNDQQTANELACWLKENYLKTSLGFVHVCKADLDGARVIN
ncbi:homoserine kinase [Thalassotalea sp. LPB0316]|uniref:homoserine kinase n=1 Tax=Thalassotalea sp. LPB0316 TaxID=2769490 RepID=UPI0018667114|nr:homoserine kinase [Thalassotalea sp. LPB0316]QOL25716.1 homoserine kinase [Thalassotalea sp. LPB0316]